MAAKGRLRLEFPLAGSIYRLALRGKSKVQSPKSKVQSPDGALASNDVHTL